MRRRALLALVAVGGCTSHDGTIRVGSKAFTESVILGEIGTQALRAAGIRVEHRKQLGGTQVLFHALVAGEIDAYPEYRGTLAEEVFAGRDLRDEAAIRAALDERGIRMGPPLGF